MHSRKVLQFGIASICAAMTALPGTPAAAQQAAAPTVLTKTVEIESFSPAFEHPSRIEAVQTASVRAVVTAKITAIHVKAGDVVEEGQLLVELDQTDYKIALAQAEAALLKARANALKAASDYERAQNLNERGTVSERDLEYAKANRDVADADVMVAIALLDSARKSLEDTKVYAPFSGRVSKPGFAVGDLYAPGDPTQEKQLMEIVSLDPIYAIGRVDQTKYFKFIATRLKIDERGGSIPPLELSLILPNGETYPYTGQFENWDNTATSTSGTIAARVLFDNPDGLLLPGENVTVHGEVLQPIEAITVPQRAVSRDQQGSFVMVVNSEGLVERRNIETGVRNGGDWAVRKGLEEGDEVIVEGIQKARPGQPVETQAFQG